MLTYKIYRTLDEMMSLLRCGKITPTNPVTVYDVSELMRAFLSLRNPNHIGKVVVTWDQNSEVKVYSWTGHYFPVDISNGALTV